MRNMSFLWGLVTSRDCWLAEDCVKCTVRTTRECVVMIFIIPIRTQLTRLYTLKMRIYDIVMHSLGFSVLADHILS